MKKMNILFLGLAILTVICLMSIGISIAEKSIQGIILATTATILITGFGFMMKKKMRAAGKL